MTIRYGHTNLVARDWRRLAAFYETVFRCTPVPPRRSQRGEWLERGTGVPGAALEGMHLRFPGGGDDGPTLEVYQYAEVVENLPPVANRAGLGHIAFMVDDVEATLAAVLAHGGSAVGEVVRTDVPGKGPLTFVYAADPEGNLVEIQCWG
jgi:catechol 2,3-dioxygenase-like lactoylglutathione lyase family enzyme